MIMCTGINHCLSDGIGTSQFLHAWAHLTRHSTTQLPITPSRFCHVLKPRRPPPPPHLHFSHPGFTTSTPPPPHHFHLNLNQYLQSQPLVPSSITFTSAQIHRLKKQCSPSLKCTSFEVLASHTWRCWVKSLDLPSSLTVKLLFSVNVRKKMTPELPPGYYGNGFVLGCAETTAKQLVAPNLHHGVKLVQEAKCRLSEEYVKCIIDLLEDKRVRTDLSTSLVISQWSKLGLEELDFGEGKAVHMGSLTSDIYCLFLPVVGDCNAVRVLVSMPQTVVHRFEHFMTQFFNDADAHCGDQHHLQLLSF